MPKPSTLFSILVSSTRNRDGLCKERLSMLKSIDCSDSHGPEWIVAVSSGCTLIQSLAPLAACTNLHKLNLHNTMVSSLKPLMGCVKLEC
jgi:hypothetical protein